MDKELKEKAEQWLEQDKIKFWLEILLNPNTTTGPREIKKALGFGGKK